MFRSSEGKTSVREQFNSNQQTYSYVSLVYLRSVEKITRPHVIWRMWTFGSRKKNLSLFAANQLGRIRVNGRTSIS